MVMVKQPDGIKRARKASQEIDGKLVTTEYTITGEPPLTPQETVLGFTRRVSHGSVSAWESHPAFGADGKAAKPAEYKDHTNAVLAIIQGYRESGAEVAATPAPAAPGEARPEKSPRVVPSREKARRAKAAVKAPAAEPEKPAAPAEPTTTRSRKTRTKAKTGAAAPLDVVGDAPALPGSQMIPVGAEHASTEQVPAVAADAALEDATLPSPAVAAAHDPEVQGALQALEEAALDSPETAAAPAEEHPWGEGYPEPEPRAPGKHRADDPFASPFAPDASSPFAKPDDQGGFVRG